MAERPQDLALDGLPVTNQDGEDLGTVAEVFVDPEEIRPSWIAVVKGKIRRRHRLVPLEQARLEDGSVLVPYSDDDLELAPEHDPSKPLGPDEEKLLVDHYNVGYPTLGTTGPHTGITDVDPPPEHPHGAVPVSELDELDAPVAEQAGEPSAPAAT
jgi:sporulation protein YlmC with PRC-barrel domain